MPLYSTRDKFDAAVGVIRSLPKEGSFQPSNEMKLRFYALYKQATEGDCNGPRPAFYDVVNRAKFDAWMVLKSTSSEEAMSSYVEELKKIVETMPHSEHVHDFTSKLDESWDLFVERSTNNSTEPVDEESQPVNINNSNQTAEVLSVGSSSIDDYFDPQTDVTAVVSRPEDIANSSNAVEQAISETKINILQLDERLLTVERQVACNSQRMKTLLHSVIIGGGIFSFLWPILVSWFFSTRRR